MGLIFGIAIPVILSLLVIADMITGRVHGGKPWIYFLMTSITCAVIVVPVCFYLLEFDMYFLSICTAYVLLAGIRIMSRKHPYAVLAATDETDAQKRLGLTFLQYASYQSIILLVAAVVVLAAIIFASIFAALLAPVFIFYVVVFFIILIFCWPFALVILCIVLATSLSAIAFAAFIGIFLCTILVVALLIPIVLGVRGTFALSKAMNFSKKKRILFTVFMCFPLLNLIPIRILLYQFREYYPQDFPSLVPR